MPQLLKTKVVVATWQVPAKKLFQSRLRLARLLVTSAFSRSVMTQLLEGCRCPRNSRETARKKPETQWNSGPIADERRVLSELIKASDARMKAKPVLRARSQRPSRRNFPSCSSNTLPGADGMLVREKPWIPSRRFAGEPVAMHPYQGAYVQPTGQQANYVTLL